jgi:F420-non-reducing hydrogenase iron-sulfur subunit
MTSDGQPASIPAAPPRGAIPGRTLTAFVCVNCARGGQTPTSAVRRRSEPPPIAWPCAAQVVYVPCTGRLQPEHLLKAFEGGTDMVCIVACQADNCHHVEGSLRAERRVDFVRGLLDEIGLGGDRIAVYHLPGSAREDMALGDPGAPAGAASTADVEALITALCDDVATRLKTLTPNPLREPSADAEDAAGEYEMDETDESDE